MAKRRTSSQDLGGNAVQDQHRKLQEAFPSGASDTAPQSIAQRLALVDDYAQANPGKPVSEFLRTVLPEFAALEMRDTQRRAPPLPKVPPDLWDNRRPDDTPMTFFMRTYAPWIGVMYESDYRRLDSRGFFSLRAYLADPGKPRAKGFRLLKRRDTTERQIAQMQSIGELVLTDRDGPMTYQDLQRLAAAMRRRDEKKKSRR